MVVLAGSVETAMPTAVPVAEPSRMLPPAPPSLSTGCVGATLLTAMVNVCVAESNVPSVAWTVTS